MWNLKMLATVNRLRKLQPVVDRVTETLVGNFTGNARSAYTTSTSTQPDRLYAKISPLGDPRIKLSPVLDAWIDNGNHVVFAELQRIIRDLRKRKRYHQALEIYEWMNNKHLFHLSPNEHAVRLDLVGRVQGLQCAEEYFNNLKDEDKTEKTYGALLHCYVRERKTEESLSHVEKMKQMGFALSTLGYNDIMCLYARTGQHSKVHDLLREMKESGVSPDNLSYKISINSYGKENDINGMESALQEMESQCDIVMDTETYGVMANFYIKAGLEEKANDALKKAEARLVARDSALYNLLISLHARLGNKDEVLRLWDIEKTNCKRCINKDYLAMLESLIKLDEFEEAEKLLDQWNSSGNYYDFRVPYVVISGYINKGLCDKAKEILDNLRKEGKASTPKSWTKLAIGYLKKDETEKAINCMKIAFALPADRDAWKVHPKVTESLLRGLGAKASAEDLESLLNSLRNVMDITKGMYHTLYKAYIRSGKEVDKLLDRMRADNIEADEITKRILSMEQKGV